MDEYDYMKFDLLRDLNIPGHLIMIKTADILWMPMMKSTLIPPTLSPFALNNSLHVFNQPTSLSFRQLIP